MQKQAVLKSFLDFLRTHLAGFSECSQKIQFHLADLAFQVEKKRFRHNRYEGYAFLPYQDIHRKLGRNFLKTTNKALDFFETTEDWSKKEKRTRGIRLSPKLSALKTKFLETKPELSELVRETGKIVRTLPRSVPVKNTRIEVAVPINHRTLTRFIKQLSADKKADPDVNNYLLKNALTILHYSSTQLAGPNQLIQRYHESHAGRLYASGVNLQNAPKRVKHAALSGYWEHDFENCHYSIFQQLAARIGIQCDAIQHYLDNKNAVRKAIAEDVGINAKQVKDCLLALMYGARQVLWHEAAIPKILGNKANVEDLYQHPLFANFSTEISQASAQIVNQWPNQNQRSIINTIDKPISKKKSNKFIMAHIQQGLEARMLRIAMKHCGDQIILLQHDGFTTKQRIDTKPIISQISDELELSMQITTQMHKVLWKGMEGNKDKKKNK